MPRRIRFVATAVSGGTEGTHVLAYSVEDARRVLLEHHITAAHIEPLSAAIIRKQGGFVLDQAGVAEAQDFLELTLPVRVRYNSRQGGSQGNWRLTRKSGDNFHNIMLKSYLTHEEASKTLWHELAHAMQAEREARKAGVSPNSPEALNVWRSALARGQGVSYERKPIEVEARTYEAYAEDLPLTRAR